MSILDRISITPGEQFIFQDKLGIAFVNYCAIIFYAMKVDGIDLFVVLKSFLDF
jgi:hypothetical protein